MRSGFLFRVRQWALLLLMLGTFAALIGYAHLQEVWAVKGRVAPSGGRYFFHRMELPVPIFRQADERWRSDPLGPTRASLAAEGCAVSAAAMVLASYGCDVDPQRLNRFLTEHGGYTPQGWLYWEAAAEYPPGRARKAYEDLPSYALIDENLSRGNPVIVRLRHPLGGPTHFVVICGKDGFDYLTCDPAVRAGGGVYPLRQRDCVIEALRFYEKL